MEHAATPSNSNGPSLLSALAARRSPRLKSLAEPGPDTSELEHLLTLASRTPDHGKLVPWRFIVIQGSGLGFIGEAIAERMSAIKPDASDDQIAEAGRRLAYAPLVIAVVCSPKQHVKIPVAEQVLSTGAVCMNLIHAAAALGFGALWLTEWYATDAVILEKLGLQEHESIAGFVHVGTVRESREDRVRPELGDIVSRIGE